MLVDGIITLICFIFLCFFQMNETALYYSFEFREKPKENSTYLGNIIRQFYKQAGIYILSLRWISFLLFSIGIYVCCSTINEILPQMYSKGIDLLIKSSIALIIFTCLGIVSARIIGAKYADKVMLYSAFFMNLINVITIPLTKLVILPLKYILHFFHIKLNNEKLLQLSGTRGITSESSTIDPILESTKIQENNMKIFRNALEFSNVRVKDCIVPRTEIIAMEEDGTLDELLKCFTKSGKSRIIIYKEDLDHIIGYIHSSDLFSKPSELNWRELISDIPIVPESMGAQKMMQIFLKQKKSLATVVDEFGGTSGIISLEDLVEEIFGDIEDEHDTITYTARQTGEGEYLLSARLEIEKINEMFNLDLPTSDEYITLGGLILYYYEDFPKENQDIEIEKYIFHIQKTTKSKIHLIKLKVKR